VTGSGPIVYGNGPSFGGATPASFGSGLVTYNATNAPITINDNLGNGYTASLTFNSGSNSQTFYLPSSTTNTDTLVANAIAATLTNKTMSGANNTFTNIPLTTGVTGILPVANGGTGISTVPGNGAILYYSTSTSTYLPLAAGTTGSLLYNPSSNNTAWLSAGATGALLATGLSSSLSWISAGTTGAVLTSTGVSLPSWSPSPPAFSPSVNALKTWTADPTTASSTFALASTSVYYFAAELTGGTTLNNIYAYITTAGSGGTITFAIYNYATRLGVTTAVANTSTGLVTGTLTSQVTITGPSAYFIGVYASTACTLLATPINNYTNFGPATATTGTLTLRGQSTTGSSLPTTITGLSINPLAQIMMLGAA